MTVTDDTRRIAQAMYQAVADGDLATFLSHLAADVVVEEPPFLPYGGTYEGAEGVQRLLGEMAQRVELSGLTFDRLVVDGDDVCAIGRAPTLAGEGSVQFVEHCRVKDGKVVAVRIYVHDPAGLLAS